ncbi:RTA1 like protein-domain-containing protein [Suillus plorans]|uniref:RTA1 like protein-domain-containing protein n=1 Tax=Suillus plorans TaxID=116603 RepID=A0A9P7AKV2_9AGAM|nr:RTA1 like protein-domain-containing protein [Suillus plorans]KAG1790628.1 RTA1 like protein-domain-containing protein [Suillus plorans]
MVFEIFRYYPDKAIAAVAGGSYFIASLCLFVRLFMDKAWWGLCLPVASTFMFIGFFMRILMVINPNSLPIFMVQQLLTLLPPAAYLAFNSILYGRFVANCVDRCSSWIKPEKVARYFVISDITTFFIQGVGGGLEVSTKMTNEKLGANILLSGLVIQTHSFAFFMILCAHIWRGVLRDGFLLRREPWGPILWILIIYRVIEIAQGNGGYLVTHEIYFYLLDSLPLLIGICTYIIYWPTKYLEASFRPINEMAERR